MKDRKSFIGSLAAKAVVGLTVTAAALAFCPAGVKAADIPQEVINKVDKDGIEKVYQTLFSEELVKEDAKVVTKEAAADIPVALVRLDNGKAAYYVDGEPYYPLAVETGWWDTRVDDNGYKDTTNKSDVGDDFKEIKDGEWRTWFADMQNMGFNAVQLMVYWQDWEPKNDQYDFDFLDHVTDMAAEYGLKTEFIIFFHSQTDNIPRVMEKFWGYDLDNVEVDGKEYSMSMQWGNNVKSAEDVRKIRDEKGIGATGVENFLEYWHPVVFDEMTEALTALAAHYKDSPNIIGYQIGNEEGFNYYVDNGDDKNPYYSELYKLWQEDNPGGDKNKFRADTINNLWKHFSNAIHEGDPYKPTTTNTQSGLMEKNNVTYPKSAPDGMTMDIYKSVDMVGSMFYGDANRLYPNLDKTYAVDDIAAYAKGFPILFPTEISATMNEGSVAKVISAQTIARGGQGIGLYCYGEMYSNFEKDNLSKPLPVRSTIVTMLEVLNNNIDEIYSGIPVTKEGTENVYLEISSISGNASQGNPTLNVLNTETGSTLGVLHFAGNANQGSGNAAAAADRTVNITLSAKEKGAYQVEMHRTDGTTTPWVVNIDSDNGQGQFQVETTGLDVTYITVEKKESGETEEGIAGLEIKTMPEKVLYSTGESFSTEGLQVSVRYLDGTARDLVRGEYEVTAPDMTTEGTKTAVVSYTSGDAQFTASFEITVLQNKYGSNLTGIDYEGNPADKQLDILFDGSLGTDAFSSGHFKAEDEDMKKMQNGEIYIQYNFGKEVDLTGVDLYTANGDDQGIKAFKLAVQDENGSWIFINENGENGDFQSGTLYNVEWPAGNGPATTKASVEFSPLVTSSVRLYITDVGRAWDHYGTKKFAMREIIFQHTEAEVNELTGIYIKSLPTKTEYTVGETLDANGLIVNAVYSDKTEQDVTSEIVFGGFNGAVAGDQWVTAVYGDNFKTAFKVTVKEQEQHTHTFGEWTVTIPPTCTEAGEETAICTECGDTTTRTVKATGHAYGEWEITKEPTLTEEGERQSVCSACGDVKTESIPKLTQPQPGTGDEDKNISGKEEAGTKAARTGDTAPIALCVFGILASAGIFAAVKRKVFR